MGHPAIDNKKLQESFEAFVPLLQPKIRDLQMSKVFASLLYHYTDFAGLKGILETGSFWFTYAKSLNDFTEQNYGRSVISKYLQGILPRSACTRSYRPV